MKILFVHPGRALLPEIAAYCRFFEAAGFATEVAVAGDHGAAGVATGSVLSADPEQAESLKPVIEWHFMGSQLRRPAGDRIVVQEYASRSTGALHGWKDRIKRWTNCRPDYRIFLDPSLEQDFGFRDGVPSGCRNMFYFGELHDSAPADPEFDFVYAGSVDARRRPQQWIDAFAPGGKLYGRSLLVLSAFYEQLARRYAGVPTIHFAGPLNPFETQAQLRRCRFGLNMQPNRVPYNRQASTKLLAYAAAGLPIISSENNWARAFEKEQGGAMYFLNEGLDNFNWEAVTDFGYRLPSLEGWSFADRLAESGILSFLAAHGCYDGPVRSQDPLHAEL